MELADTAPHLRPVPAGPGETPSAEAGDDELLALVAERDRAAFEVLYRRYVSPVFGLALRRLGDRARAEDAVQEAFGAIWRAAPSYREAEGPARAWLHAVAADAIGVPGPGEAADVAWRVHRALEELPAREREVLELAYWSGLPSDEVAAYLNVPAGTMRTRARSGLARLSETFGAEPA